MYLLFMVIGALTAGFLNQFEAGILFMGAFGGLITAIIFKFIGKWWRSTNYSNSNSGASSAFDGCILFILIEAIFHGIGDI